MKVGSERPKDLSYSDQHQLPLRNHSQLQVREMIRVNIGRSVPLLVVAHGQQINDIKSVSKRIMMLSSKLLALTFANVLTVCKGGNCRCFQYMMLHVMNSGLSSC